MNGCALLAFIRLHLCVLESHSGYRVTLETVVTINILFKKLKKQTELQAAITK